MDVINFSEVREGDTIEVDDAGQEVPGKVTYAYPNRAGDFIHIGVKVGLLSYGYDHTADDAVVLLDRPAEV